MDRGYEPEAAGQRTGLSPDWTFLGVSALLFTTSAGGLIYWTNSMSGGDTSATAWMRMPGQTWLSAAGTFMGMWMVMMLAMMLPSLTPSLLSYRRLARRQEGFSLGGLTALAGAGYFIVWAIFGIIAYPLGVIFVAAEMQWMVLANLALPLTGLVLILVGILQFTGWKARMLGDYREMPALNQSLSPHARNAWKYGLRLGVHCALCCIGFMAVLLVTGVMDLGAMALIAAAITIERLAPKPELIARLLGVAIIVVGALMIITGVRSII